MIEYEKEIEAHYLIAHEVGHALVAICLKLKINSISLGVLETDSQDNPNVKLAIDLDKSTLTLSQKVAFFLGGQRGAEYLLSKFGHMQCYYDAYQKIASVHAIDDNNQISRYFKSLSQREISDIEREADNLLFDMFRKNDELFTLIWNKLRKHKTISGDQLEISLDRKSG
jgi:hypothetical protein